MHSLYYLFLGLFTMFMVGGAGFYLGRIYELKIHFRREMLEIETTLKEIYKRREERDANSKA